MSWKQTLILGGAVLLLAACDRATAPIANAREGGAAAKNFEFSEPTATTDTVIEKTIGCSRGIPLNSGRTEEEESCEP
jgi:hypothetical protein